MGFDTSIFQLGRPSVELMNHEQMAQGAMRMSQLAQMQKENQYNQALQDSYRKNTQIGSDGRLALNQNAVMSDIAQLNPQKAFELQSQFQKQAVEKTNRIKELAANEIFEVHKNPDYYPTFLQKMTQLDPEKAKHLPPTYDENIVRAMAMHALPFKDQLDQQNKDRLFKEKQDEFGIKRNEVKETRDARISKQTSDQTDKLAKAMKDDFDADRGRSGNFGQISAKVQSADRLQTLIQAYKNGDLPKAQMEELSLGMANMLAGSGGAARAQVEALVPHTFWGNVQDAGSWLMNEPRGAGQQKFVEKMADTIQREKDTANNQLNQIRAQRLPSHEKLKKIAPDMYNNLLQSYGLDPSNIKNGKYVAPTKSDSSKPQTVTQNGHTYTLNPATGEYE